MKKNDLAPLAEVIATLENLSAEGETGTLFVGTNENKFAQIAIDKGRIVFVMFGGKRGKEAISLFCKQKAGRYNFKAKALPPMTDPLPPNDQVLTLFRGNSPAAPSAAGKQAPRPQPEQGGTITAEILSVLQEELAKFVGPVAALICSDHCAIGAPMNAAIEALAAEIGNSTEIQAFRMAVRQRLE